MRSLRHRSHARFFELIFRSQGVVRFLNLHLYRFQFTAFRVVYVRGNASDILWIVHQKFIAGHIGVFFDIYGNAHRRDVEALLGGHDVALGHRDDQVRRAEGPIVSLKLLWHRQIL